LSQNSILATPKGILGLLTILEMNTIPFLMASPTSSMQQIEPITGSIPKQTWSTLNTLMALGGVLTTMLACNAT
jgi:hypothetical protein